MPGGERWAIEVKRGLSPKPTKGFHVARAELKAARAFVVYSGQERYPLAPDLEVIGLRELTGELARR